MKILVLGGGAQGGVVAHDLARSLPNVGVRVADVRHPDLAFAGGGPAPANLEWLQVDLSDDDTVIRLLAEHDVGVGALPSSRGPATLRAAIEARCNLVAVSSAEHALSLDAEAKAAGVAIVPDCGLAPGISNLLVGRMAAERGAPAEATIWVGGVAADASRPYGYTVTWCLDDLLSAYSRPARVLADGRVVERPAFDGLERVEVEGVGTMEAFLTDGLRTLLETMRGVRRMEEKTLRWPGHADAVRPLLAEGRLLEELRARCVEDRPRDLVVLIVRVAWDDGTGARHVLVDRADPVTGFSAMARTTALTTSVVAQLAARGGLTSPGVQPLERVARDERAAAFVLDELALRGVRVREDVSARG